MSCAPILCSSVFFFNAPATTEIYTLSLHDALPILPQVAPEHQRRHLGPRVGDELVELRQDRKSTRLNSSHDQISYAVFCLKKKKKKKRILTKKKKIKKKKKINT